MLKPPDLPLIEHAQSAQLENDTAALYLTRRASQCETAAIHASNRSNAAGAMNKVICASTLRTVARRLVLTDRPVSLGLPRWSGESATP